ncbi:ParA family protein [Phocaeicola vulgatus]|nr:ParA family protein [Phocaeicola vulgatus]
MMKKEKELLVAIASQKGGVGKSVFTVLLASVLHYRKGMRVAVVDCDSPQHSIALMRDRDVEGVMKNDDLKVNLYRQYERIRKPAYPVIKSDPEKAMEDLRRYMDEKGETFDIVLFDLPGTLRSEGVVHTVSAMDYIFVPLKADNIVMQSSLQFAKVLEEELIAKGNCNLKGIRLFWNMVDRRGRKDLYDAWNRVIHRMGLRLLSSHIPNTLRYNREADTVCKGVFRSTLFPPDPRQEKGSGLPELVEEICPAIGLEESDTDR